MVIEFNPARKKTLLTVDGGGARGLIPLMALTRLEELTGKPCYELFDFVAGTSVGALIAGGIAAGQRAADLVGVFESFITDVFRINYPALLFRHHLRYLYDTTQFRRLLDEYTGGRTLADLETAVLFTAKDMARAETIFFVNRGRGAAATGHVRLADAVEASTAAPIYFRPKGDAVDGGVGTYGNVCYVATVEAMEYLAWEDLGWEDGNVIHCSFGTGKSENRVARGAVRRWMPWKWPLWVIGEMMDEASEENVRLTMRHYGKRIDFRRYQVSLLDDVLRDELGVTIPAGLSAARLRLNSASPAEIGLIKAIGQAFAGRLDFTLTGEQLIANPPPGTGGAPYRSRLPALTREEVDLMLGDAS